MRSLIGGVRNLARPRVISESDPRQAGMFGLGNTMGEFDSLSNGTVYQTVQTLASSTSMAPWTLYRKRAPRGNPNQPREVVNRHAALSLLERPNNFFTRQSLMMSTQVNAELTGEGILLVVRNEMSTIPVELWPINPKRMRPVPDPDNYIIGWVYTAPDGERIPLDNDQVIKFVLMPDPRNPIRGLSPIQALTMDLETAKQSSRYVKNFYLNDAQPGGMIEAPNSLSDEAFKRLKTQWENEHRGVANAHRVAILEEGARWVSKSSNLKDMEYIGHRELANNEVRRGFGMAKTMLGETEQVNRASAEAAEMVFRKWKSLPRLDLWRQALNSQLLPLFGSTGNGVEFDFDAQIPENEEALARQRESKTASALNLVNAGFDPEDVLMTVGLPPMRFEGRQNAAPAGQPT